MLMKYKDFKVMSQKEMKQVLGGDAPLDKPCSKCCTDQAGTDCSDCKTGLTCAYYEIACPRNQDGTCLV